jgi:hypothetical protein
VYRGTGSSSEDFALKRRPLGKIDKSHAGPLN